MMVQVSVFSNQRQRRRTKLSFDTRRSAEYGVHRMATARCRFHVQGEVPSNQQDNNDSLYAFFWWVITVHQARSEKIVQLTRLISGLLLQSITISQSSQRWTQQECVRSVCVGVFDAVLCHCVALSDCACVTVIGEGVSPER